MNNKLKICIVSAAYRPYPSGVSEHTHHLALALKELGQDVSILTTNFPKFRHLMQHSPEEIPVYRLGRAILVPLNYSYATLPVGFKLPSQVANFLYSHNFDIVHCHGLFWPEISYWALRYSRTTNLITFLTAGFKIRTRGRHLFRLLFHHQLKKIHGRIAISNRAKAAIHPYLPGEYRIIPSGVNLRLFHPGYDSLPETKTVRPTILFVGRLDKRKGLELLIKALPLIQKDIPDIQLIVVGKGPMEKRCRSGVKKAGLQKVVQFAGAVKPDDLPRYYCSSNVFCAPTLGGETQGVVLLEAMACGTPVVASNIPGYDETVQDGKDGLLFPPGDIEALARSILRILNDKKLRTQIVEKGYKKVKDYAWPVIARKTLAYYQDLLALRS